MAEAQSVLIAGTWRPANAEGTFQPDNPTTKEKTGEVYPVSTVEDVEEAVEVAAVAAEQIAEIGDEIDRRVKGYSGGMKGKLGFGFITSLNPDILLIDETLSVGDQDFRVKAQEQLRGFVGKSGSVIMSTHSLGLAREMCNRGLVLNEGSLIADSDIEGAMLAYRRILKSTEE